MFVLKGRTGNWIYALLMSAFFYIKINAKKASAQS